MKLKLLFWSAVLLAVVGAYSAEGTLFYFFATHLMMIATGLCMIRRGCSGKSPCRQDCVCRTPSQGRLTDVTPLPHIPRRPETPRMVAKSRVLALTFF
jgi:hypothetical protein